MSKKSKKAFSSQSIKMYKNYMDPTDLLSCYTGVLNTMKHNSFTGHCNDIDMYNDISVYDYIPTQYDYIHSQYDNNEYE